MKEITLNKKEIKKGVSIVEKCRETKAKKRMMEKRHEKYMEFTRQTAISHNIIDNIVIAETIAASQKKEKLSNRKDPRRILFKKFAPKKKNTSVFSDEDFTRAAEGTQGKPMQGFVRIR